MKRYGIIAAVFAVLALPSMAHAATPVTSLTGDWGATNSSLRLTPDGVNFGIYPDANSGGSLYYGGMNGLTLADVEQLSYTFRYTSLNEPDNYSAAPYLRIFLNGDTQDVILDPSMCATQDTPRNEELTFEITTSEVRYSDDGCNSNDNRQSWADVVAAHGADVISGIYVTQGFSVGTAFSADLFELSVNGEVFDFGAPQAGPEGPSGQDGTNGSNGVTTVITDVRIVPAPTPELKVLGATLRTLTAPARKGQKIVRVKAWLRGAKGNIKLNTRGRLVIVDLRGKSPANYNIVIHTTYRKADGTTRKVRSERHLSVTLGK